MTSFAGDDAVMLTDPPFEPLIAVSILSAKSAISPTLETEISSLDNVLGLTTNCSEIDASWSNNYNPLSGCTNSSACNYDSFSDIDDNSCYYANSENIETNGPDLLYLNCDGKKKGKDKTSVALLIFLNFLFSFFIWNELVKNIVNDTLLFLKKFT